MCCPSLVPPAPVDEGKLGASRCALGLTTKVRLRRGLAVVLAVGDREKRGPIRLPTGLADLRVDYLERTGRGNCGRRWHGPYESPAHKVGGDADSVYLCESAYSR